MTDDVAASTIRTADSKLQSTLRSRELNPETATLEQCQAALNILRTFHFKDSTKPVLMTGKQFDPENRFPLTKDWYVLHLLEPAEGNREFVNALLKYIPEYDMEFSRKIQRSKLGGDSGFCIFDLPPLAKAINSVAKEIDNKMLMKPLNTHSLVGRISEVQNGQSLDI